MLRATPSELTSLDQIVRQLARSVGGKRPLLSAKIIQALWQCVADAVGPASNAAAAVAHARGALAVLSMAAAGDSSAVMGSGTSEKSTEVWLKRMKVLCKGALRAPSATHPSAEWELLRCACVLLQRLDVASFGAAAAESEGDRAAPSKAARVLTLLSSQCEKVIDGTWASFVATEEDACAWYGAGEQALNALFVLNNRLCATGAAARPEEIAARVLHACVAAALTAQVNGEERGTPKSGASAAASKEARSISVRLVTSKAEDAAAIFQSPPLRTDVEALRKAANSPGR